MWPGAALAHVRQQADDQLHGPEVVELHRAFEVVEAVVAERDRAADRAAGVVDEHVHVAVVGEHALEQALDRLHVGDVGRVHVRRAARGDDLRARLLELLDVARHQQRHAAGGGDLQGGRAADPRGGAGDHHVLAAERLFQRPAAREVGVHLALPVLPQARQVLVQRRRLLQRRARRAPARSRAWRSAAPARCARAPPRGCRARAARALAQLAQRRQRERQPQRPLRQRVGQAFVDAHREARRVRDRGELVDQVVDALRARVGRGGRRGRRGPGSCAMCSSAAATQSTGTMLV